MFVTVLFAHGSRDPAWQQPMLKLAQRITELSPGACVRCAFLELTPPDLPTVAAELVALGATRVTIMPLFLGVGKHAREDLPLLFAQMQQTYPKVDWRLKPSTGEEPRVIELLAKLALE
jgi:sirohydrochlorin cobaltochelatase